MSTFMRNVRSGYASANKGDITFASQDEALAFFQEHWDHGATNEAVLGVTVECQHCNEAWDFTGSLGFTPRRSSTQRMSDNDRSFF